MPWVCPRCRLTNIAFNKTCADCKMARPDRYSNDKLTVIIENRIMEKDRLDKHAEFYNREKIFVQNMDHSELREHINKLELIIIEAKARYSAATGEERERQAKMTAEGKSWLVSSDYDPTVSDALATVKQRQKRMSQADKLKDMMTNLGVEGVDELIKNVEKKATDKQMSQISFNKSKSSESTVKTEDKSSDNDKAFDPSTLFGS